MVYTFDDDFIDEFEENLEFYNEHLKEYEDELHKMIQDKNEWKLKFIAQKK